MTYQEAVGDEFLGVELREKTERNRIALAKAAERVVKTTGGLSKTLKH